MRNNIKNLTFKLSLYMVAISLFTFSKSFADEARPRSDDTQIDWVIPSEEFSNAKIVSAEEEGGGVYFLLSGVPRRLFSADSDVLDAAGRRLMPRGEQLYQMIGTPRMLCSQSPSSKGYLSAQNRICIIDDDSDGKFDTYFTRTMGTSFVMTDGMWFAMNSRVPSQREHLSETHVTEINRMHASQKIGVKFRIFPRSDLSLNSIVTFDDDYSFYGYCQQASNGMANNLGTFMTCGLPDLTATIISTEGKLKKWNVKVNLPKRDVTMRFDVAPRLLGGRVMRATYLF